jgi:hypothetical protein
MKVLRRVLVLRGIAASHVAANLAQSQMHPGVAHFEALFAAVRFWLQVANLIGMRASVGHGFSSCFYSMD